MLSGGNPALHRKQRTVVPARNLKTRNISRDRRRANVRCSMLLGQHTPSHLHILPFLGSCSLQDTLPSVKLFLDREVSSFHLLHRRSEPSAHGGRHEQPHHRPISRTCHRLRAQHGAIQRDAKPQRLTLNTSPFPRCRCDEHAVWSAPMPEKAGAKRASTA